MSENDFECFASTGVNTPLMAKRRTVRPSVGHPIEASPSLAAQFPHRNAHDHAALSKWVHQEKGYTWL